MAINPEDAVTEDLGRLQARLAVLRTALRPFAKLKLRDEGGILGPFVTDNLSDADGVDITWRPDDMATPLVIGHFRRAETAYDLAEGAEPDHALAINMLASDIHEANVAAGWWHDLRTGERLNRNVGELLCLVHSEISEAMEGHRKGLMDDKLPHRPMIEVELADAVIRIADIAGGLGLDLGGALVEKLAFNAQRADHKPENRRKAGGKAY